MSKTTTPVRPLTKYQLEQENATLRKFIGRYAGHLPACAMMMNIRLCTCGYNYALREVEAAITGTLLEERLR